MQNAVLTGTTPIAPHRPAASREGACRPLAGLGLYPGQGWALGVIELASLRAAICGHAPLVAIRRALCTLESNPYDLIARRLIVFVESTGPG